MGQKFVILRLVLPRFAPRLQKERAGPGSSAFIIIRLGAPYAPPLFNIQNC